MIRKYFFICLALVSIPMFAEDADTSGGIYTINTPTAFTLPRAGFDVSMLAYDRGGMEFKTIVGVHDAIFIGVSLDVDHAVGKEKADANTPGVVAKLKLTDGWESFPISIALGYDSFYIGAYGRVENSGRRDEYSSSKYNRKICGPYFAITKPLFAFGSEQYLTFGMRLPVQPDYVPKDATYFASLDVPLGTMFAFKAEGEKVYYNFKRKAEWLGNLGLKMNFTPNAGVMLAVIFQDDETPCRILKVEYASSF